MLDKLLNFILQQKLFQLDEKVLLAVSGGIDSVVLVDLFQKAGIDYEIAHCNFQLRGKDSDDDQLFVSELAKEQNVGCYTEVFDTEKHAKKHRISIQMAARELRKDWFNKLLEGNEFSCIALAHHANDSLETVLFNLAKGTGIAGLKGILPKKDQFIRPLLFASREMITEYAKENKIRWREDRSNSSIKYHRNLIRHNVMPELKKINPKLEDTFVYSAERIASATRLFDKSIKIYKAELLEKDENGFRISKAKLRGLEDGQLILFEILEPFGFNYGQAKDILLAIDGQPGKEFFSKKHKISIDRSYVFLNEIKSASTFEILWQPGVGDLNTPLGEISFEEISPNEINFSHENNTIFLDFDKLRFPLTLRSWRIGDRFQPLGMKHKKKLSDFMIDEKIPLNLKEQVNVITSEDNIIWVVGHRIDDRYKITPKTKRVLKICNSVKHDKSI